MLSPRGDGGVAPVRLIRSSWLQRRAETLACTPKSETAKLAALARLPHRAELEASAPEAFMSIDEVINGEGRRRKRFNFDLVTCEPWILTVSHAHLSPEHPDPSGQQLIRMMDAIERTRAHPDPLSFPASGVGDVGVFLDWCSLYQPSLDGGAAPSAAEAEATERALDGMDLWYAHRLCRLVVLDVPAGWNKALPMDARGWPCFEMGVHALARQALHGGSRSLPPIIVGAAQLHAPPPRSAADFALLLSRKAFAVDADRTRVGRLYATAVSTILNGSEALACAGLGWGDDDVEALAKALPLAPHVRTINLSRNSRVGERGIAALCYTLVENPAAAPRLQELNLQHLHSGPRAVDALSALSRARAIVVYV